MKKNCKEHLEKMKTEFWQSNGKPYLLLLLLLLLLWKSYTRYTNKNEKKRKSTQSTQIKT